MSFYDEGTLINKIRFLSTEQKERVLNFVESIESNEPFKGLVFQLQFEPFELRCVAKYHEKSFGQTMLSSDDDIVQILCHYMRQHHHLLIGRPTAEKVIEDIGSMVPLFPERTFKVKGRDLDGGLPRSQEISSIEVREQIKPTLEHQIHSFAINHKYFLHRLELPEQILTDATIRLCGRYGYVKGLAEIVEKATGLKVVEE